MADSTAGNRLQTAPVKIFLPVTLTLVLFGMTIFLLILPILEKNMMDGKREMIRALTESAWSALDTYAGKAAAGNMSRSAAQARAIEHLRGLRYGPESKDYFWINDMRPYLLMHPYRRDLEGEDISNFTDPSGKHLFVEFVKTVRARGAGYVDYQWQWKDDPDRIVPKISFVKGFAPWGWIIGTGIYVEDVHAEIASITRKLTLACLAILLVVAGLSSYVIWQGARSEKFRRRAETALRKSEARYRLLAETAGEFIVAFDLGGKITYANRAGLAAMGYGARDIKGMPVEGILPDDEHPGFRDRLARRIAGDAAPYIYETRFVTRDGLPIPVEVTSALLLEQGRPSGVFIIARDITEKKQAEEQARRHQEQLYQAGKLASIGTLVSGIAHEINNPITSVMLNSHTLEKVWRSFLPVLDECLADRSDFFRPGPALRPAAGTNAAAAVGHCGGGQTRQGYRFRTQGFFPPGHIGYERRGGPQPQCQTGYRPGVQPLEKIHRPFFSRLWQASAGLYGQCPADRAGRHQPARQCLSGSCGHRPVHPGQDRFSWRLPPACFSKSRTRAAVWPRKSSIRSRIRFSPPGVTPGGTGLGLAVSDRIVQDHGGTLNYISRPGRGTTVRVCLPLPPENRQS